MSETPDFRMPARDGERDSARPRFFIEARPNPARSEKEGHPCFDDVEMVEILIPGDRNSVSVQIVKQAHKDRWPQSYAAFKAGAEGGSDGTPLTELPGMTASQVQELKYQNVTSIEALAGLSDDQVRKTISMGGMALRDKAQRWMDATKGDEVNEKLAAENRELRAKMETMEAQMADILKRMPKEPAAAAADAEA